MPGSKDHILVTGCPRSGTTFLGTVLTLGPEVGYVREPFNYDFGLEGLPGQFAHLYEGMPDESKYKALVDALVHKRAKFRQMPVSQAKDTTQGLGRLLFRSGSNYSYLMASYNPRVKRYLFKDPMACLSAEYLHRMFGLQTVVIIRHPIPNIASMQRVALKHSLTDLARQPRIYDQYLKPILGHVEYENLPLLEQQSLLWACINLVLYQYTQANPQFIVIRHEDISRDPEPAAKQLYRRLGLQYSDRVDQRLKAMTGAGNPGRIPAGRMHVLKRNSRELAAADFGFTRAQERTIHALTDDVTRLFYPTTAWPQTAGALGASPAAVSPGQPKPATAPQVG